MYAIIGLSVVDEDVPGGAREFSVFLSNLPYNENVVSRRLARDKACLVVTDCLALMGKKPSTKDTCHHLIAHSE